MNTASQRGLLANLGYFGAGVTILITAAALWFPRVLAQSASADVPSCIQNGDYGQVGAIEDPTAPFSDDSRGTRSNVHVASGPTPCQRVSSIYVFSPDGTGDFEFGWVIGYSNCSGNTYSHPHLFFRSKTQSTGEVKCKVWTSPLPTEGADQQMRASDVNGNTYWGSYFLGDALQPDGVNMDFNRGFNVTGMERGDASDNGAARWNDLEEYHDGNGWTHWNNPVAADVHPVDPDYHFVRINSYTVKSDN